MKDILTLKKMWIYVQLVAGCALCSIGVNWIAIPNGFAVTGMTGLAMTIAKVTGIHYAWMSYGIMAVVLFLTLLALGLREVVSILFLSVLYPAVLLVLSYVPIEIIFAEKLIAVVAFGLCYGIGTGMMYRLGYSCGGTDTLGKILKNTLCKAVPLKTILLGEDIVILFIMLAVFKLDIVAYAFVGQFIYANSMNFMVFSTGPKLYDVQIICDYNDEIKRFVIEDIQKDVTVQPVIGGYTGAERIQLDCVCTSKEYIRIREYIKSMNVQCFMKVQPLLHVFGLNKDFRKLEDNILE